MSQKRLLTEGEIALLSEIYGERDYFHQTTIERGNWYMGSGFGAVSNNNIRVGKLAYSDDFSKSNPAWFIHEGAHLVQEQTFGRHLLFSKGAGKFRSLLSNDYQYEDDVRKGVPFEKMSIEAQASMIADYYRAVQGYRGRYVTLPIEVYQRIIPESFVPSFGRKGNATSGHDGPSAGARQSPRELDGREFGQTENPLSGSQTVPRPQPKPRTGEQPAIPLSNTPLMPGALEILPPFFVPERREPKSDLSPAPLPQRKPKRNRAAFRTKKPALANPFDLNRPQLKQQADMLEGNPLRARQMILAAGRDPKMFGLN